MAEDTETNAAAAEMGSAPAEDAEGEGHGHSHEAETEPEEPAFDLSEEAREPARRVRDVLQEWSGRIAATGGAGRGATITARMASARALAELRRLQLPELPDIEPVRQYLRRATEAVTQAAHDIERNRYSLHAMHHQLERIAGLEKRILPEEKAEESDAGAGGASATKQPEQGPESPPQA